MVEINKEKEFLCGTLMSRLSCSALSNSISPSWGFNSSCPNQGQLLHRQLDPNLQSAVRSCCGRKPVRVHVCKLAEGM